MRSKLIAIKVLVNIWAALLLSASAYAQEPTRTTATYGAWIVQCNVVKKQRVCEMVQTLAGKNRQIVARVAIGRLPESDKVQAVVQVPNGADLTVPASLTFGDDKKYPGRYVVCAPKFCRSEIVLPAEVTGSFKEFKKASISFRLLNKTFIVPIKLEGMQVAFNAATKSS